jgi:hypothetical protein
MDDAERSREEGKTHRCSAARAAYRTEKIVKNDHIIERLGGYVGDAAASPAVQSTKKDSSNLKQFTAENALVLARILALAECVEEGGHNIFLVLRTRKMGREAAPGYARRDFGVVIRRAADTGDIGTYETTAVW